MLVCTVSRWSVGVIGAVSVMAALTATAPTQAEQPAQASEQPQAQVPKEESDIVVEAPLQLPVPPENLPTAPRPKGLAIIRMFVLYNDLNLSHPADADRLMQRIDMTARQACDYLNQLYPLVDDPDCAKRAAATATPAARAAIAAAQSTAQGVKP